MLPRWFSWLMCVVELLWQVYFLLRLLGWWCA